MASMTEHEFVELIARERGRAAEGETLAVPIAVRLLADQLTPIVAYRRMVERDERTAPSFLLESVEDGSRQGRYSLMGSDPAIEVVARAHEAVVTDRRRGSREAGAFDDPVEVLRRVSRSIRLVDVSDAGMPECVLGGWFGYASYDTVRYAEPGKLGFAGAPADDRGLPDLVFGFYDGVVVFDHADRVVHVVQLVFAAPGDDAGEAYRAGVSRLDARVAQLEHERAEPIRAGRLERERRGENTPMASNTTREEHRAMVERAQEYIRAGDIFQVVVGQRFERQSAADPFDVYRCLRAVNPSPYMVYMQCPGVILVASSPEILCRVRLERGSLVVTNRPLAGTRARGATGEEDRANEADLLADPKEVAEHAMLVDLGRNDVGVVARPGSVELPAVMEIERYSHVMHISSTVTGELRDGLDCWDALRAALPVGTISGAPKIRAMQIIDELEKVRRGPYGGGMGWASLDGEMDVALALRTMVVPTELHAGGRWTYHVQAAGGIVADSEADAEYMETVNKAAALGRAIELAEGVFGGSA